MRYIIDLDDDAVIGISAAHFYDRDYQLSWWWLLMLETFKDAHQ